jgi:hypothetical protein
MTIFWPKRDEIPKEWRKLHNEELHNMYYLIKLSLCLRSTFLRHMEGMEVKFPIFYTSISSNCRMRQVTGNNSPGLYWSCGMLYLAAKVHFHSKIITTKLHFNLVHDKLPNIYKNYVFQLRSWMAIYSSWWRHQWMINMINIVTCML